MTRWKVYYNSIDELPMHNWLKLNKGEYVYLLRPFWFSLVSKLKETPKREQRFKDLYDQYIQEIGLTDDYMELLNLMKRHALNCAKWMENSSSINRAKMEASAHEMEAATNGGQKEGSFFEFVAMVEKYMGIQVDLKTISVSKFYAYVELMKKENGKENIQQ